MRARWLQIVSVLSLLLCAAVVALWVRSYRTSDLVAYEPSVDSYSVWSERGEVCLRRFQRSAGSLERWRHEAVPVGAWSRYVPPQSDQRGPLGFYWESGLAPRRGVKYVALVVPYWAPAAAPLVPPLLLVARHYRRRKRARAGHCAQCGYDLRASGDRCPECGHAQ